VRAVLAAAGLDSDADATVFFAQGNDDAFDAAPLGGAVAGRRKRLAMEQTFGDGVDIADETPGEGAEQGRDLDPGIDLDRDDQLAFRDARVGQVGGFGADPHVLQGATGENDDGRVGFIEAGVDGGDDIVARADLTSIPPVVDAAGFEVRHELHDRVAVRRGVADEGAHGGRGLV